MTLLVGSRTASSIAAVGQHALLQDVGCSFKGRRSDMKSLGFLIFVDARASIIDALKL